ncbi:DNA-directed RNA polymerase III subunit RPC3-like [Dermacentor silvarum]|uniref:DNA-directed RNA polymerase III subunit RPC3-like n=1 Tax=Dermacentor silvarum TaxID=543639 RepID=UPI0021012677|nr:DNA-directed RNA polymerase III subunit RPC3-like [Dermacentor silvarum]
MSHVKIRACSIILKDHFGSVVQSVGECLLKVSWRSLGEIARATNLPLAKIKKSLMVLIHQNLVDFEAHPKGTVKYSINADRVLCMLRYSRYIYCTKMLYGDAGEFIIEEVLLNGRLCMSLVLQKVLERLQGAGTAEDVNEFDHTHPLFLAQLSRQVLEWCYKALANMMLRRIHITDDLKRLLDKKQRVDLILSTMHPNNSTPEQIAEVKEMVTPPERKQLAYVRHVTSKIGLGEVQLDETILILQLYILSLSK